MNFENLLNENVEWEAAMALAEEVATNAIKQSLYGIMNEIHGNFRVFFIVKPLKNIQPKGTQLNSTNISNHKSIETKRKIEDIGVSLEKLPKKFKKENVKVIETNDVTTCSTSAFTTKRKVHGNTQQSEHEAMCSKRIKSMKHN